jgi:dTDP-4-dehydrorhamnose reductase
MSAGWDQHSAWRQVSPKSRDRLWIIGDRGQIGGAVLELLGDGAVGLSRSKLDLGCLAEIAPVLDRLARELGPPSAIVNSAAYTLVDDAERNETTAMTINALAPQHIAGWCADRNVPLVHFSSDYVYSGAGSVPWRETDGTAPVNAYGRTKLAGDVRIQQSGARFLIFRTSWVYSSTGRNFFTTILRLAAERKSLRVVWDQVGSPTYARHVAAAAVDALGAAVAMPQFPAGIYHTANSGAVAWSDFAHAICEGARHRGVALACRTIEPISSEAYAAAARRPLNSRLDQSKLRDAFGIQLPPWQDGLEECLDEWRRAETLGQNLHKKGAAAAKSVE